MSITEANTETEHKTISPEDLPSSDNLGVTVSFPLANSTNYDEWAAKFLIKVLTLTIKKLGSTDTCITEPAASSSTFEVWNGRYSAVRNWLRLLQLQMSFEESASIWKDRISLLPDSLLCHILSFLTTKEAVCTSVLSSRWRDLWKWVPSLDLVSLDFPSDKVCVDFINEFLLNLKSLNEFKLCLAQEDSEEDDSIYELCMDKVTKCKIQHFQVNCYRDMEISLTLPVCEALVSLKLYSVNLNDFESLSLPCLKVMFLEHVIFPHSAVFDTPRLENLTLTGYQSISFMIIKRMSDHVKVDIDVDFQLTTYDLSERNIIYNFLNNFSAVKDITLSMMNTFELFYCFHFMNPLPKFRELTRLRATMWLEYSLELLPLVLETCPNLRHLTLNLVKNDDLELLANCLSEVLSFCLVSSLEYVDIESPITEKATEEEVVRYFLGNATSLKKLVLRLNVSDGERHNLEVLKQCFDSPRRSSLCQFEVLLVVQTQDKMKEL